MDDVDVTDMLPNPLRDLQHGRVLVADKGVDSVGGDRTKAGGHAVGEVLDERPAVAEPNTRDR